VTGGDRWTGGAQVVIGGQAAYLYCVHLRYMYLVFVIVHSKGFASMPNSLSRIVGAEHIIFSSTANKVRGEGSWWWRWWWFLWKPCCRIIANHCVWDFSLLSAIIGQDSKENRFSKQP
jgi:hypothetical protein